MRSSDRFFALVISGIVGAGCSDLPTSVHPGSDPEPQLGLTTEGVPSYQVVFIGSLIPDVTVGQATAVNESSDVVGYVGFGSATWDHVPFFYNAASGPVLLTKPSWAVTARALDVSDRHGDGTVDVVGYAAGSIYSGDLAMRWVVDATTGTEVDVVELGSLPGLVQSQATAVNRGGDIVGYSGGFMTYGGPATLFTEDGPTPIGSFSSPAAVTDSRWVLVNVSSRSHRYSLNTGELVDMGVPEGRLYTSYGAGMNEAFQVAATVNTGDTDPRGQYIAQVWRFTPGQGWTYIAGGGNSLDHARGINNLGDVIAQIVVGLTYNDLLYVDALDQVFVIESLLAAGFEGTSIGALNDINDAGEIATSGPGGPVLLTGAGPLPPPPAPTDLTAIPHAATPQQPFVSIDLSWTGSSLAQTYEVERAPTGGSFARIGTTSGTTHRDMSVQLGVTYDYRVRGQGLAGASPYSDVVTVTAPSTGADVTPPTLTILEPSDGSTVKGTVSVTVSAADESGIWGIDISATGAAPAEICSRTFDGPAAVEVTCSWNTRKAEPGDYAITARAYDTWGRSANASVSVTVGSSGGKGKPGR